MTKRKRIFILLAADYLTLLTTRVVASWLIQDAASKSINMLLLSVLLLLANVCCYTYRANPRYTTIFTAIRVSSACLAAFSLFQIIYFIENDQLSKHNLIHGLMYLPMAVFIRFIPRIITRYIDTNKINRNHVVIYGAGQTCYQLIQHIKSGNSDLKIVGLIDDNNQLLGEYIDKYRVLGDWTKLKSLKECYSDLNVIIAIPSATGEQIKRIKDRVDKLDIKSKVVSRDPYYFTQETNRKIKIIDIDIEAILQRPLRNINYDSIEADVKGKTILVTGGAGSIGSEIVRQLYSLNAAKVIVADFNEYALYKVSEEFTDSRVELELGDITDRVFVQSLFKKYKLDYVFHACAYKHVPLGENNPCNTIYNNISSAKNIFDYASKYKLEKVVLISSDKAVNPSNVMGASKRICEKLLLEYSTQFSDTIFSIVRFGNVLGSSGSVVPKFIKQIENNEDITVTHQDITRYFMSIPEASCLVLQASAECLSGRIYVLDMKEPIKLVNLAENLIKLYNKIPYVDVNIVFTGLRPGEKLYEELHLEHENSIKLNENYWEVSQMIRIPKFFESEVNQLLKLASQYEAEASKKILFRLVRDINVVKEISSEGRSA